MVNTQAEQLAVRDANGNITGYKPNPDFVPPANPYTPAPTVGSQEWYASEIQQREQQARANTLAPNPSQQALIDAQKRPGYSTNPGDSQTARYMDSLRQTNPQATDDQLRGIALEQQRQDAVDQGNRQAARFYANERNKWAENKTETSSAYHALGKAGNVPIPANPYEYQGDLAVEYLKGQPGKTSEWFSPASGQMSKYLPGGMGTQQYDWDLALGKATNNVSFMAGTQALGSAEGMYGPYGNLQGGKPDNRSLSGNWGIFPTGWNRLPSTPGTTPIKPQQGVSTPIAPSSSWTDADWGVGGVPVPLNVRMARAMAKETNQKPSDRLVGGKKVAGNMSTVSLMGEPTTINNQNEIKKPFLSTNVETTREPSKGELPFFGVVPFISPLLAHFQPDTITTNIKGKPVEVANKNTYGADFTNSFIVNGKLSDTWTYDVGEPIKSKPYPVGQPQVISVFNPTTGETTTTTTQQMQQDTLQNRETATIPKTKMVTPISTFVTYGKEGWITPNTEEPKSLSFGGLVSDFYKSGKALRSGDIMGSVGIYSQGMSRYTTRPALPSAVGFGKYVETTDTSQVPLFATAAYAGEEMYSTIRNDPVQDIVLFSLPTVFKAGEIGITNAIARTATSESTMVSRVGRIFSTPTAISAGSAFKAGLGGAYVYTSGMNYMAAPDTPEGKGRAIGVTAYQVGMTTAGIPLASQYNPVTRPNPYFSRTYFTGERQTPFSDQVMIKAGDWINGVFQTRGQRRAIASVSNEYMDNAYLNPENTLIEPDISHLSHVRPGDIGNIRAAATEQPSVMYGSGTIEAQIGTRPAATRLRNNALPSSDVDIFAENPTLMEATAGRSSIAMDVHGFPEGYVDVGQGANTPSQPGSYFFGNRYRTNPYIDEITFGDNTALPRTQGYTGELSFEHLQVQYRKLSSAVRDDIADPMNKGYRLPKDISRLTRVGDALKEVRQGTSDETFNNLLDQTVTYNERVGRTGQDNIRTDTLRNIRARYESGQLGNIPGNPRGTPYTRGAISSVVSHISPGAFLPGATPFQFGQPIPNRQTSNTPQRIVSTPSPSQIPYSNSISNSISISPINSISSSPSKEKSTIKSLSDTPSMKSPSLIQSSKTSLSKTTNPSISGKSGISPDISSTPSITSKSKSSTKSTPTISPSFSTSKTPSITSTPSITKKTSITVIPPFGGLPGNSRNQLPKGERGAYAFKEVSPTWTPGEMGRALFTGSFKKQPTAKQRKIKIRRIKR